MNSYSSSIEEEFYFKKKSNKFDLVSTGDLNFRIEKEQEDMIKELNSTTDFGKLLQNDQLLKAIKEGTN